MVDLAFQAAHPDLMLRPADKEPNQHMNISRHPLSRERARVRSVLRQRRRNKALPRVLQVGTSPWLQIPPLIQTFPERTVHSHRITFLVTLVLHRLQKERKQHTLAPRKWNESEVSMPTLVVRRPSFQVPGLGAPGACMILLEPKLVPRERIPPARALLRRVDFGVLAPI